MKRPFASISRRMAALVTAGVVASGLAVGTAGAAMPRLYKNCTELNKKYPHGVGRVGARDRTKSGDPVTTFKRSNRIYKTAIQYNSDLDRDKDGIACEKA